jgi:hypothetical protein
VLTWHYEYEPDSEEPRHLQFQFAAGIVMRVHVD